MLTAADERRLGFYSQVGFLRAHRDALTALESDFLRDGLEKGDIMSMGNGPRVHYRHLQWDSTHFGVPMYRLVFASCQAEFGEEAVRSLADVYRALVSRLSGRHPAFYAFAEVPSEDLLVLQALCLAGFRLVETRLTYYRDDLQAFASVERHPARLANQEDIANLMDVARRARNSFDRYHADSFFPQALADDYLATYAANSVLGYTDMVIVPAPDSASPDAFLAGKFDRRHEPACGMKIGRIALTAVAPERRGWNRRLNSELMHWFKERGAQVIYTTTQSTNRAAIRVLESLDYGYGRSTHVLTLGVPLTRTASHAR